MVGWWLATAGAAEETPGVELAWSPRGASVRVTAPPGQKLAADAPAALTLSAVDGAEFSARGLGTLFADPVAMPRLVGGVTGRLDVGLCTLDGATCRPASFEVHLTATAAARGRVTAELGPAAQTHAEARSPFGPDADAAGLDAALARAATSGKPVLVDFSAAWCPPCNQLAADWFHRGEPALDAYEVVVLDADHPSSFPAKDRYDIGGYPTVLVIGADGAETTRMVGYPGKDAFRVFLGAAGASRDGADLRAGPSSVDGARAATLAWALASAGDDAAAGPWLDRAAAEGADTADRHLAALALRGDAADLQWIVQHAPERAVDALGPASAVAKDAPADILALCDAAATRATGSQQADVLELRAKVTPPGPEREALLRGAIAVIVSLRTGDPAADKPNVTWLAALLDESGQGEAAVRLLEQSAAQWPDEPTYDLALGPLLMRLQRPDDALVAADRAVARAWGDNHLRAVATRVRVLMALGRADEARAAAKAELAAQPAPEVGTNPRTDRYRATLQKLADGS